MKILSVSRPGGDRGPAIGYSNHAKALSSEDFVIEELSQTIWQSDELMKSFDVAWAYVRFHPQVLDRCKKLGMPFVSGPNVVLERADEGITDEWEKWFFERSNVDLNLNVADYYTEHVRSFSTNDCKFKTLEYCYELDLSHLLETIERSIDVTVYVKNRPNDKHDKQIATEYCNLLDKEGLSYQVLTYGSYGRQDYLRACCMSKVTAWFSIEDYCSLAQIESHLAGSAVIGTPYNLTIPFDNDALCTESQKMDSWIEWRRPEDVARDYLETTRKVITRAGLSDTVRQKASDRHSYETYRKNLKGILRTL